MITYPARTYSSLITSPLTTGWRRGSGNASALRTHCRAWRHGTQIYTYITRIQKQAHTHITCIQKHPRTYRELNPRTSRRTCTWTTTTMMRKIGSPSTASEWIKQISVQVSASQPRRNASSIPRRPTLTKPMPSYSRKHRSFFI